MAEQGGPGPRQSGDDPGCGNGLSGCVFVIKTPIGDRQADGEKARQHFFEHQASESGQGRICFETFEKSVQSGTKPLVPEVLQTGLATGCCKQAFGLELRPCPAHARRRGTGDIQCSEGRGADPGVEEGDIARHERSAVAGNPVVLLATPLQVGTQKTGGGIRSVLPNERSFVGGELGHEFPKGRTPAVTGIRLDRFGEQGRGKADVNLATAGLSGGSVIFLQPFLPLIAHFDRRALIRRECCERVLSRIAGIVAAEASQEAQRQPEREKGAVIHIGMVSFSASFCNRPQPRIRLLCRALAPLPQPW